jgi:hypothetical protein
MLAGIIDDLGGFGFAMQKLKVRLHVDRPICSSDSMVNVTNRWPMSFS